MDDKMFGSLEANVSMQVDVIKGDRRNTIYLFLIHLHPPLPHTQKKGWGYARSRKGNIKWV